LRARAPQQRQGKSFLLLFFKKEDFLPFFLPHSRKRDESAPHAPRLVPPRATRL
jgi:hypothetical protein